MRVLMILERNEHSWLNSSVRAFRLNVRPCSGHLCALTLKVNGSSSCILRNAAMTLQPAAI